MRGLQIVCSPNRSTQEWPPTWCTKGSSITPFPGYGVPSACMRASRAGLILTPHRTAEPGGGWGRPSSHRRRGARPLVRLLVLGPGSVASHGGAADRPHGRKQQRAEQEGQSRSHNPLFPLFSSRRGRSKKLLRRAGYSPCLFFFTCNKAPLA